MAQKKTAKKKAAVKVAKKTAKKVAKKKVAIGDAFTFNGYTDLEDGEKPILKKDEEVTVTEILKDDAYMVKNDAGKEEEVFGDEITPISGVAEAVEEATADVEVEVETKPAKAKGKVAKTKVAKTKVAKVKVATPAPKVEEEKAEEVEIVTKNTRSVTATIKEHGGSCEAARALIGGRVAMDFRIGGVFCAIKRDDAQTKEIDPDTGENYEAGLVGFNKFLLKEFNWKARRADYFLNIYQKFSPLVAESQLNKIGWTKLRELLSVDLNEGNVEEWLTKAKSQKVSELRESVKKTIENGGGTGHGNRSKKVSRKIVLHNDQAELYDEVLKAHRETMEGGNDREKVTDGAVLIEILTEYKSLISE